MNLGISSQIVHRAVPALAGIAFLSVFFASPAPGQMRAIDVDASKVIGTIRSLQGLNNGPAGRAGQPSLIQQYHELGIDTVRTHDSGADINAYPPLPPRGPALGIFPKWEADPRVPESYDFSRTDEVVNAIIAAGAEVYFRLGSAHDARMPPDFDKYADICQHVVMHYNGGWANGYHYNIRYWEFWNEPNLSVEWWGFPGIIKMMPRSEWDGPPEKFFELYEKVARAVVAYDTDLKVGANGYAPQSHSPYREEFIEYCARHKVPFDFFSWHAYMENSGDPYEPVRMAREVRQLLDNYGFRNAESHLGEWNLSSQTVSKGIPEQNSMADAAFTASVLMYLQDAPVDLSQYYSGRAGGLGLFDAKGGYGKKAYVFKATKSMLDTKQRVDATGADTLGFAVLAGRERDMKKVQVLISNYEIGPVDPPDVGPPGLLYERMKTVLKGSKIKYADNRGYALKITNLPWGKGEFTVKRYRLSEKENLELVGSTAGTGGMLQMTNPLPPPSMELIVLEPK